MGMNWVLIFWGSGGEVVAGVTNGLRDGTQVRTFRASAQVRATV